MRTCTPRVCLSIVLIVLLLASPARAQTRPQTPSKPWPVRVVVIATFPGEFQLWQEREHLSETIDLPGVVLPLHTNPEHTILGMISGTSLINSAASTIALGLDPRFDLTHAYFLINGIAGIDPQAGTIGSAAWANFVVGDVMRELDPREAPADWPYGLFPNNAATANPATVRPSNSVFSSNVFALNPKLVAWAFQQTRDLKLPDDPQVAPIRTAYVGYPNALHPPSVLIGDTFASDHYWHGKILTQFARDWVRVYTGGKGTFVMTEMEDSGFMNSLVRLDAIHRVDINRVLVLRTASNFSMQPPGTSAYDSLTAHFPGGGKLGFESAWACGSVVVHKILADWGKMYEHIPGD
jgi:purine nucleoside permease